jgi:osmoprotectant transport system substrate-binding protein/osmoprotectant transport system permease protein
MRHALVICALLTAVSAQATQLTVGSKRFTESTVLGEMVRLLAERAGVTAEHKRALGNTRIVFAALERGVIDVYPEYTGTLRLEILRDENLESDAQLRAALEKRGLRMSDSLGFANSYGVAATKQWAATNEVSRISQLAAKGDLEILCSHEFVGRADGFSALKRHYGLAGLTARGMDHDLAYTGLASGVHPLIIVYTTEPEIAYHDLRVLEDDRGFFPLYEAVLVYRQEVADSAPMRRVLELVGRIDAETMIGLNLRAKPPRGSGRDRIAMNVVADEFLAREFGTRSKEVAEPFLSRLGRRTIEQLILVGTSLLMAILLAIPLGVLAARHRGLGHALLALAGVLQTVPSLALLVILIPVFGLGAIPAVVALFVYSLLPILRNTHSGLTNIPAELKECADALGLESRAKLFAVELPLAMSSILAGIKTAAVINVGTATLGAFIGAGGYGRPILDGISLNDNTLILEGAIPAAMMAVCAQLSFDAIERLVVSKGLRP